MIPWSASKQTITPIQDNELLILIRVPDHRIKPYFYYYFIDFIYLVI